jgi:hypothetical protein
LLAKYPTTNPKQLAIELDRTINSIYARANQFKMKKVYRISEIDRFMDKIVISTKVFNNTPCWEWVGAKGWKYYGTLKINHANQMAHRWAYEYFIGNIPDGHEIDHLCRNRSCVNAMHLEAVTAKENILRGEGACANNARKTHCKCGHEFNLENTRYTKKGTRYCVICRNIYNRKGIKHEG